MISLSNYPFEIDSTKLFYSNLLDSDASIRLLPAMIITDRIPDIRYQGYLTSSWENLSLLIEPVIVHNNYGENILGTEFTRYGISGRIINAFIRYKIRNAIIQFGRSPVWWGQSWDSSIIQSGDFPPYDHIDLKFTFGNLQLELLMGQLGSDTWDNEDRIKRYIAGHKVIWLPTHKRWIIGFGDQIIYTGKNRSTEFHYINPVLSYIPAMLNESSEAPILHSDNDNVILFAFGRYVLQPNISIYSELIIDEFQVDDSSPYPNSLGLKLGLDGAINHFSSLITYAVEFNKIDSWTYIHPGQFTSWKNLQFPIGYKYGPDCWSILFSLDYWIKNRILFSFETTHLEKGFNSILLEYNALNTRDDPFPTPPVSIYTFNKYSISWLGKRYTCEVGWSNVPFSREISSSNAQYISKGSIFFKAQLLYDFGFDLN